MMHKILPITPLAVTPSTIAAYRSLRLTSLRVDPSCFGSTYTRKFAFANKEWQKHISSSANSKWTFVRASIASSDTSEISQDTVGVLHGDADGVEHKKPG
ncbi:hypothetical protein F5I97DRAFT_1886095 [Phlebopus sp. FC_14]|nr:hypothetical protein F5I97DRAFT_1886095 [Phlebopus sp. FC_14]